MGYEEGTTVAADHPWSPPTTFHVAPTDGSTAFNTVRTPLAPIACWRLNDPAFDFDSSFILPAFSAEVARLAALVQAKQGCPAAIFAHADPAGSDDVNKTISDRRAIAVYALLTRQPPLWEDLYAHAVDGDAWGTRAIQSMLQTIVGRANDDSGNPLPPNSPYYAGAIDGAYGPETTNAVKAFQTDSGLAVDGDAGPMTRKVLFGAYMDVVCTSPASAGPPASGANANGPSSSPTPMPFRMQPADFLGGASAGPGDLPKMSLQGCSRFNPIVLLTSDEMNGDDQTTRNADDAPNRRVLVFFFAKGTTLDAGSWPCPKVKEACDACKSAFWSDADQRRANGDARREYKTTQNTMACRFYDRFARSSPCESGVRQVAVVLRLVVDGVGTPLPARPFTLTMQAGSGGEPTVVRGSSDDRGYVRVKVPQGATSGTLVVQHVEDDGSRTDVWSIGIELGSLGDASTLQGARARLANLGLQPGEGGDALDDATLRAINRFRALQGLPVLCLPSPGDPAPDPRQWLDSETVRRLIAVYEAKDGSNDS
jgi:hypothetical protein